MYSKLFATISLRKNMPTCTITVYSYIINTVITDNEGRSVDWKFRFLSRGWTTLETMPHDVCIGYYGTDVHRTEVRDPTQLQTETTHGLENYWRQLTDLRWKQKSLRGGSSCGL